MCDRSTLSPVAFMSSPEMGHLKIPSIVYRFLTSVHTEAGMMSGFEDDTLTEHLTAISCLTIDRMVEVCELCNCLSVRFVYQSQ